MNIFANPVVGGYQKRLQNGPIIEPIWRTFKEEGGEVVTPWKMCEHSVGLAISTGNIVEASPYQ